MKKEAIINELFNFSDKIRYAAIYSYNDLVYKQREEGIEDSSSGETDKYEELLVNPTLLTLTRQRGNLDCGGLDYLIIKYGNFYQLVKAIPNGHISICLNKKSDLNTLPNDIFLFLKEKLF
ncbi:MAG: hypothetical protein MI974_07330 [Chitinophagales bacterium]|nr:hypothetical protein [Chitinophagales bacterium]